VVVVNYEVYDGMPLLSKWIELKPKLNNDTNLNDIKVGVKIVEELSLNLNWNVNDERFGGILVQADEPHGPLIKWDT